jgi:hypothetical protein
MKRPATYLVLLYPPNWRARYSEEFETLLEDCSPGISGLFDLIKGAIKMRLAVPSFPKLALVLSIAGLVSGLGVSFAVTPRYVSSATMIFIQPAGSPPSDLRDVAAEMRQEILSRTSLSRIIQDLAAPAPRRDLAAQAPLRNGPAPRLELYESERVNTPLEDVIEKMRTDLDIKIAEPGPTIDVKFAYRDPVKAQNTVQVVVAQLQEANLDRQRLTANLKRQRSDDQIDRLEARIAALEQRLGIPPSPPKPLNEFPSVIERVNLDVLDPATLPVKPVFPDRVEFMSFGFGSGFVLALVIAIFRHRPQPAIPFPAATA